MKEILIEVDENGNVKIEAFGFVGGECKEITKSLESMFGKVTKTELKPEYRQARAAGKTVAR